MRSLLLAVDDGLTNANYNWADIFFLVATILAVLAALAHHPAGAAVVRWAGSILALAVACVAAGLFLLQAVLGADVEWSSVTAAGAFILGVFVGIIGTLRVAKLILEFIKHRNGDGRAH